MKRCSPFLTANMVPRSLSSSEVSFDVQVVLSTSSSSEETHLLYAHILQRNISEVLQNFCQRFFKNGCPYEIRTTGFDYSQGEVSE